MPLFPETGTQGTRPVFEDGIDQDRRAGRVRRFIVAAFVLAGIVYLGWRTTAFNPEAPLVSAIFFATELLGFGASLVVFFVALAPLRRVSRPAPPGLSVDVFVTTLDEDLRVVRRALLAAIRIRYPHLTWLLDDGDRPELRQLAAELGCRYLARSSSAGAKAGNINHGLVFSAGEFVVLLDADHCAQPNFLDRLLGYFEDPDVAFVQTPQDYYNTGSFQHAFDRSSRSIWHEQSSFHHVLQPGRDHHGATTLCGCSCILRRAHLDLIGGFPEETVTEDMHAAVRLQKLGLKSVFHDEPLAFGVAPPDFRGFLRQRLRWGEGNMQVCRIEGVPFSRGLSFRQNVCYMLLALAYADAWRKLVLYVAPPLTLLFEVPPVYGQPIHFLAFFLPYLLLGTLAYSESFRGFSHFFLTETFDMARLGSSLAATWGLFRRRIRFRVSSKKLVGRLSPLLSLPQVLIGTLCLTAVMVTALRWSDVFQGHREMVTPVWIEAALLLLCLLHLAAAAVVLKLAIRSASMDEINFAHSAALPVRVADDLLPGPWLLTRSISLDGATTTGMTAHAGEVRQVELLLPDGMLRLEARCIADTSGALRLDFQWPDAAARDRLDQALHAGRWHRVLAGRSEVGRTFLEWLGLVRAPVEHMPLARHPWQPVVLRTHDGTPCLGYLRVQPGRDRGELIHFAGHLPIHPGIEAWPVAEGNMRLAMGGLSTAPMLDEGALDPLGAMRVAVRIERPVTNAVRPPAMAPAAIAAG